MHDNPVIDSLLRRRSVLAATMVDPAPSGADLETILRAGIRVPDHGKLEPWRIQILRKDAQKRLGDVYAEAVQAREPNATDTQVRAARERLQRAPLLLVVTCHPNAERFATIPRIEQQLSCAAVCMNLLTAAGALGYAAQWLTGGPAYESAVKRALGHVDGIDIIGFIHLGSSTEQAAERPRPDFGAIVSEWTGT